MKKIIKKLAVFQLEIMLVLSVTACRSDAALEAARYAAEVLESTEEASTDDYREVREETEESETEEIAESDVSSSETDASVSETNELVSETEESSSEVLESDKVSVTEDGEYTSKDEVALYIHLYDHLPDNYITKKEAEALGWNNKEGNLWDVAPGKSIGGSYFGNYEGLLPEKKGRDYHECDIDYNGGRRNAKRIVFSDDGLIYYTEDHYESFEQLY